MRNIAYLVAGFVLGAAITYGLWTSREPGAAVASSIPVFNSDAYLPDGAWSDLDGDCQDTRTEVLLALGLDVGMDDKKCTVVSGAWRDVFTGEPLNNPAKVAIVRIVPLTAAHKSGAWAWDSERKIAFANSFERSTAMSMRPKPPLTSNLVTVSLATKKAKDKKSIVNWIPRGRQSRICAYAESWITVKAKWGLSMNEAERDKVIEILSVCP